MAEIRKRNGMLIVIGVLILALLVYLILDFIFGHILIHYKTCPKYTKNNVHECWACYGETGCKKPYQQLCTHEAAWDTHLKLRQFWKPSTDDQRRSRNLKHKPKDDAGEFIIGNHFVFKCLSIHGNFQIPGKSENVVVVRIKGCIYEEWVTSHIRNFAGVLSGNNYRDTNLQNSNFFGRYACHNNLCNDKWNIHELLKPRSRRFFEGPYAPDRSAPKPFDLSDE